MRLSNQVINVEYRELSLTPGVAPKYRFTAVCTSDECRLSSQQNIDRTDVGAVKRVSKASSFCPACGYALFWSKEVV